MAKTNLWILSRLSKEKKDLFGKQTHLLSKFCAASRKTNLNLVVVTIEIVKEFFRKKRSKELYGFYFSNSVWKLRKISRPDVIFDRYYSSMKGLDTEYEKLLLNIIKVGCRFINPPQLSKITTDKLEFSRFCNAYNIQTPEVLESFNPKVGSINQILKYQGKMVLKPRFGRMGKGIIVIDIQEGFKRIRTLNIDMQCNSDYEFEGSLLYFLKRRGFDDIDFILQKYIITPGMTQKKFDIRMLLQRDGEGKLSVTGMYSRVQGRRTHVPNISQGGFVICVEKALKGHFSARAIKNILGKCGENALYLYESLEKECGMIGELGIDLIVDIRGDIWIMEVNSKPGRYGLERLSTGFDLSEREKQKFKERRVESIKKPLYFAEWLTRH